MNAARNFAIGLRAEAPADDRDDVRWGDAVERVAAEWDKHGVYDLIDLLAESDIALWCALSGKPLHPADRAQLDRLMAQCKRTRESVEREYRGLPR